MSRKLVGRRGWLITGFAVVLVALLVGCSGNPFSSGTEDRPNMTVYFSDQCSCCKRYVQYLRDHGFSVEKRVRTNRALRSVKMDHGVSRSMSSCHTAVMGDYVVEGHVPVEALDQLMEEQPDIRGVSVPDMPRHSPGMGPPNGEPLAVYSMGSDPTGESLFTEVTY